MNNNAVQYKSQHLLDIRPGDPRLITFPNYNNSFINPTTRASYASWRQIRFRYLIQSETADEKRGQLIVWHLEDCSIVVLQPEANNTL